MAVNRNDCLFLLDTPKGQGFIIKNIVEVLEKTLGKETEIEFTKKGIVIERMDPKGSTLICFRLPMNKFKDYKCDEDLPVNINLKQLLGIVKNIKKKDSISMYIKKNKSDKMAISVSSENASKKTDKIETWHISVQSVNIDKITKPEERFYKDPINIPSPDYQKMCKKLTTSGSKTISLKIQGNSYASFFCNGDEIVDFETEFGVYDDTPEIKKNTYVGDFHIHLFNQLIKLPGLAEQMSFYAPKKKEYPLKIGISAGMLGEGEIYLKNKKQMEFEESTKKPSKTEDDD